MRHRPSGCSASFSTARVGHVLRQFFVQLESLPLIGRYTLHRVDPYADLPCCRAVYLAYCMHEALPAWLYLGQTRDLRARLSRLKGALKADTGGLDHTVGFMLKHRLGIYRPQMFERTKVVVYAAEDPRRIESTVLSRFANVLRRAPVLNNQC